MLVKVFLFVINFGKMIVTCILYLILPNLFCAPLNQRTYIQRLKKNKIIHSPEEKCTDENTVDQIEEGKSVYNLDRKNQHDKSNVADDYSKSNDYTKYKHDNQSNNKRIDSLFIAKNIRKTTVHDQSESSSNIYIYIDGAMNQKRNVWRWSCLSLFVSIVVMIILLKLFYYYFDLGFYHANPERTELLTNN